MKKTLVALGAVAMCAAMVSCDNTPDMSGTWSGNPTQLLPSGTANVTGTTANSMVTTRITFTPSADDKRQGTVTFNSDISVMDVLPPSDDIIESYELSVAATATASGTYTFAPDDDDDVLIALDNSTLVVKVDPSAVTFNTNVVTGNQQPLLEQLKPGLANSYMVSISNDLRMDYAKYQKLDDVKVHNGIMTFEVKDGADDRDLTLRKVN